MFLLLLNDSFPTRPLVLSLFVGVSAVVDFERHAQQFDESFGVLCGPAVVHLAVFSRLDFVRSSGESTPTVWQV